MFDGEGDTGSLRMPSRTFFPSWRHSGTVERMSREDLLGEPTVTLILDRLDGVQQADELQYPFDNEQRVWLEELENDSTRFEQQHAGGRGVL